MDKHTFVVSCPIDTYSGYGARSRDFVKALIELDRYDVKILPQRWGNTAWGFIKDHEDWKFLEPHLIKDGKLTEQPDIWCQITVPNEFTPVGKYNIGVTAGIESTIAPAEWVAGCQRMNLVLGSSKHTIDVLKSSKFNQQDQQGNIQGTIEWTGDGEVLFEGVDTNVYKIEKSTFDLDYIKENFCYLYVGHWLNGDLGEDRKNTGLLVKAFLEVFKNKKNPPALLLKATGVNSSYMDRDNLIKKIKAIAATVKSRKIPNIYLLHGDFTNEEMNSLYNHPKVKSMVNLTKGEGFGRPLLEFSCINKPIITTNWSGHIDYLNPEFTTLLPGQLKPIHPSAANNMLLKEAQWFNVDHGSIGTALKDVFENYKSYAEKAKRQGHKSRKEFSFDAMKEKLGNVLEEKVPELPKKVQLNLPKLQLPKLSKITS